MAGFTWYQKRKIEEARVIAEKASKDKPRKGYGFPKAFLELMQPARYKVYYGGRGSAKSWTFAEALVAKAHTECHLILCARQFQSSIKDSVHKLLRITIHRMGLDDWFTITDTTIISKVTGTAFIFKGIHQHPDEIKSLEGVTICWVEEAQSTSKAAWEILIPTIRLDESEIWVSFNPMFASDATSQMFIESKPAAHIKSIIRKVSWRDNPFLSSTLNDERLAMLEASNDDYQHVWEGNYRKISAASVLGGKVTIAEFETPLDAHFYYGADWGFSQDPTTLIRSFVLDDVLYVDHEAYGVGVEFEAGDGHLSLPELFNRVPGSGDWPIYADSARPETISYMCRQGFNVISAKKWHGSVEDGIARLRGFKKIIVHPRCKFTAEEMYLYSYKVDKMENVLPILIDKHNHTIDALRYSLGDIITARGDVGLWERLAS
jgi:phage terminase large subunit